jgi:hypothetical protein
LYSSRPLSTGLPGHIKEFCKKASNVGAIIVLPRTVLLEIERLQIDLHRQTAAELEKAAKLLRAHGIRVPEFAASEFAKPCDIAELIRQTGIRVEEVDANLDDYRDAEYRAAHHLPPQGPEPKSDEMRDLVIWTIALRIAKGFGGSILVSRDKVHSGESGSEEARSSGLQRATSVDEALEMLEQRTAPADFARKVLQMAWNQIIVTGLPIPEDLAQALLSNLEFETDAAGFANAKMELKAPTLEGVLTGNLRIQTLSGSKVQVEMTNLSVNERQWQDGHIRVIAEGEVPRLVTSAAERLRDLRDTLDW